MSAAIGFIAGFCIGWALRAYGCWHVMHHNEYFDQEEM